MTLTQMRLATIGAVLSMVLGIVDSNIVATAAWPITKSLDPVHGLDLLPWLITAYALASTVTQPMYGKLTDVYGPKKIYLFSLATFLVGSALCGIAQNMGQLIAFRAVQGVGGGGLMSVTLVVVLSIWPPKTTSGGGSTGGGSAGMGGVMTGVCIVVGPLVGGYLTEHLSWRWIFYVNLPLGLIALGLGVFNLRLPVRNDRHRIDFLGAGLIAAATSALLLVTEWGGAEYAWSSSVIVLLELGGALLLVAFLLRQGLWSRIAAEEPLFPLSLFRNQVFRLASPQQFISGMVTMGSVVYVALYLQAAQGVKPTLAGVHLLPMALGMIISAVVGGRLIRRPGRFRLVLIAGTVLVTIAFGLLSRLRADTSVWVTNVDLLLLGAGLGLVLGMALLAVQMSVPKEQMGVAITSIRFSQTLGGAVGSAVFGTILAREFAARVPDSLKGGENGNRPSIALLQTLTGKARDTVVHALVGAADQVFVSGALIAAVAVLITLFFKEPRSAAPAAVGETDTTQGLAGGPVDPAPRPRRGGVRPEHAGGLEPPAS
ncbi:Multidrug resistance protein 3 [Streptomyces cyanogenus]|uniref:Multidrug resistance protein 3 n=2 Tax=Streptomyces cyanogenus TaxID=80860 RepID=A0ABX7TJ94_STRCY|nr:Multidrug resistance protein 3 [Streptomyces cyanogenus]